MIIWVKYSFRSFIYIMYNSHSTPCSSPKFNLATPPSKLDKTPSKLDKTCN